MATEVKSSLLEGEFAPIPDRVAAATAVGGAEDATNALLRRHFPRYFLDREEDLFPCDLNK